MAVGRKGCSLFDSAWIKTVDCISYANSFWHTLHMHLKKLHISVIRHDRVTTQRLFLSFSSEGGWTAPAHPEELRCTCFASQTGRAAFTKQVTVVITSTAGRSEKPLRKVRIFGMICSLKKKKSTLHAGEDLLWTADTEAPKCVICHVILSAVNFQINQN